MHRNKTTTDMKKLEINKHTKVLVSAEQYDLSYDKRLLVPFTSGEHIGFVNRNMEIVVSPKYRMYYGECYSEKDYIKIAVEHKYGFQRASGNVVVYERPLFGLINYRGEVLIEPEYLVLSVSNTNSNIVVGQKKDYKYGVIDINGNEIVPFGKYDYIDAFDRGLARVKIGRKSSNIKDNDNRWGIINEAGEEVLFVEYDNIWNFKGKNYDSIVAVKDKIEKRIPIAEFSSNSQTDNIDYDNDSYNDEEIRHYEEYAGSYAQDYMGFSDEDINDAFDGDPEAYWNID